jgi:hypothetical protein
MMKRLVMMGALLFVSIFAFRITERLSTDAIGMGLGVLFGLLAGIPTALLVLAAVRRKDEGSEPVRQPGRGQQLGYGGHYPGLPQQPPVIILAGNGLPMQMQGQAGYDQMHGAGHPLLPGPAQPRGRDFRVFGESNDSLDDIGE